MHESVEKYAYNWKSDPTVDVTTSPSSTPPSPPPTQKPHKCPHRGCGRQFNRKYTLVEHMKTHTGEKPHHDPVERINSSAGRTVSVTVSHGGHTRGTRNPGIADVLSSIFDEMEYASSVPEKPLLAPPLQPQNLLDDMVNFHVAHIEL
ncbi:Histone-lysine N-methyltransferase setd3 [Phytophthora nicotianae]|uniref:Histone-lysine N-methyltransferase setd3 n=1 Tax=Phytophthora nicotianae TaxID=4792 RepID=A0A0W8DNF5_PHYNI|nr:Histone-lysine N-methyltransferase setd3 [Phytophthora nicotianae]